MIIVVTEHELLLLLAGLKADEKGARLYERLSKYLPREHEKWLEERGKE